jgi:hypothetical protein
LSLLLVGGVIPRFWIVARLVFFVVWFAGVVGGTSVVDDFLGVL